MINCGFIKIIKFYFPKTSLRDTDKAQTGGEYFQL